MIIRIKMTLIHFNNGYETFYFTREKGVQNILKAFDDRLMFGEEYEHYSKSLPKQHEADNFDIMRKTLVPNVH